MIKVLFLIDDLSGGGAERVLAELANALDKNRFDVTVLTVYDRGKYRAALSPRVHYRSLNAVGLRALTLRARAALGLPVVRGDYDVLAAYLECGPTKLLAPRRGGRTLKLAWVHCDLRQRPDIRNSLRRVSRYYAGYDKVVCVSENVREGFSSLFGPVPESVVLHNVVDEAAVLRNAAQPLPEGLSRRKTTLVGVGRLTAQKGFDRLLDAAARLLRDGFDFELWLLGEGPERAALERQAGELGVSDAVRFLGFLENPYPCVAAADTFVCSSRFEGFSTAVTEALILGRPVITTDCTGMRELLGGGEYGVITENSADGLYEGLRALLSQPGKLERLGGKAAERERYFSKERLTRETEAFLEASLAEKRGEHA